jgi:hypothetical protein
VEGLVTPGWEEIMTTRHTVLMTVLCVWIPGSSRAGEIVVRTDREHLTQGESALVTITVRGSNTRPLVTPPTIPYCQVEQVQAMELRLQATQRGVAKSAAPAAGGRLAQAFDSLQRQVQEMPNQISKDGLGDAAGLLTEYEGMLQDIRRQAQAALQNSPSRGPGEYQAVYRLTPQRSGELTVTPFILKINGSSFFTKPLALTIDAAVPKAVATAGTVSEHPSLAASEPGPNSIRGLALKPWHGLVALLAAPVLGATLALLTRRRRPRPTPTASSVQLGVRRAAMAKLAEANGLHAVAESLSAYVRVRCHLPEGELTPAEAATSLRTAGVSESLADRVATILDACSAARFAAGGIAVDEREVAADARRVADHIECADSRPSAIGLLPST